MVSNCSITKWNKNINSDIEENWKKSENDKYYNERANIIQDIQISMQVLKFCHAVLKVLNIWVPINKYFIFSLIVSREISKCERIIRE